MISVFYMYKHWAVFRYTLMSFYILGDLQGGVYRKIGRLPTVETRYLTPDWSI